MASTTDQRGVVIDSTYDGRRAVLIQKVTSLGDSGQNVDGRVRSISRHYGTVADGNSLAGHLRTCAKKDGHQVVTVYPHI